MTKNAIKKVCDHCGKETSWMEQGDAGEVNEERKDWLYINIKFGIMSESGYKDFCSTNCVKRYIDDKVNE